VSLAARKMDRYKKAFGFALHWGDAMDLAKLIHVVRRTFGRGGPYPHQLSFTLSSSLRRFILSPAKLVERLELNEASRVLELGPGPGYFSVNVACSIPRGYLLLIDLQREMLEKARQKLKKAGVENVGCVQGDGSTLPLRNGALDVVFLVAVLGEVHDQSSCLREIYRVLRPKGLLSITGQPGDPDFIPLSEVRTLAEGAGFGFARVYGRGKNYTASFIKPTEWDTTKSRG